jgi:hypothetical protein
MYPLSARAGALVPVSAHLPQSRQRLCLTPRAACRFLKLAIIVLMLLVMIVLQLLRVLRRSGLTTDDILELIGLRSREEL